MSEAHRSKKQPLVVRSQLLDVASRLCVESGLHAVTLDAVARAAGVSKGGLLHHFPTKQALFEALSDALLGFFEARLRTLMQEDDDPHGAFTRAYLRANLGARADEEAERWNSLAVLLMAEAPMRQRWSTWIGARLNELAPEEKTVAMRIVRTAADGLWLNELTEAASLSDPQEDRQLIDALLAMTRKP